MSRRLRRTRARWVALGAFLFLLSLTVLACSPIDQPSPGASTNAVASAVATPAATAAPATSPSPSATPEPQPLEVAKPSASPLDFLAWAFTPVFQTLFIILALFYWLTGNVLVAILLLTVVIRALTWKLSAQQIISSQRMMRLQPELKALQKEFERKYKGDRLATNQAMQAFYKERGVSPTAGCLPSLLQMGMLFPMYYVIRGGLTSYDPSAMLSVFNVKLVPLTCPNPAHYDVHGVLDKALPCINTVVGGIDMGKEQILFNLPLGLFTIGISALAIIASLLQVVQSRMLMPPPTAEPDANQNTQRTMMIVMPLIFVLYGGLFPAGLFIYYIVGSIISIVQQFLIVGWGSMFPLFGWTPAFAANHTPRFPVTMPEVVSSGSSLASTRHVPEERRASAASTVRPNTRRRAGRRGRRH